MQVGAAQRVAVEHLHDADSRGLGGQDDQRDPLFTRVEGRDALQHLTRRTLVDQIAELPQGDISGERVHLDRGGPRVRPSPVCLRAKHGNGM